MNPLNEFKKNITSQWGEDGIIEEIFRRLGTQSKRCVEFGAWDGKHLSNTWNLWHEHEWSAVLIESDSVRVQELKEATRSFPRVQTYHALVSCEGPNGLDAILNHLMYDQKVDLLCIDVDGDDYHIFQSIDQYLPRVLVIEYNPTIPPYIWFVQETGEYIGASAMAIKQLASQKGYTLAAMTETNCFFVKTDEFSKLGFPPQTLNDLFPETHLMPLISSFDGVLFTLKKLSYADISKQARPICLPRFQSDHELIPVSLQENLPVVKKIKKLLRKKIKVVLSSVGLFEPTVRWYKQLREHKRAWDRTKRHKRKQQTLLRWKNRYTLRILIETGTYFGDMVEAIKHHFQKIYSIELDQTLFKRAQQRFQQDHHVHILQGDSAKILPILLTRVYDSCLFWLDGHFSGGITAKGETETPILRELEAIFQHHIKTHVILIDDIHCFTGTHDYPTVEELKTFIHEHSPYSYEVHSNVLVLFPPSSS